MTEHIIQRKKTAALVFPPCKVCSGKATGIHYGVNTCESCKAFYRRAVIENLKEKYKCINKENMGRCEIKDMKRGNCSACRIQKCIDLGMSKDAVRHGRYTIARRTKTIMEVKKLSNKKQFQEAGSIGSLSPSSISSDQMSSSSSECDLHQSSSTLKMLVRKRAHRSSFSSDSSVRSDSDRFSSDNQSEAVSHSGGHSNLDDVSPIQNHRIDSCSGPTHSFRKSARILEQQPPRLREMIEQNVDRSLSLEMTEGEIVSMIQHIVAAQRAIYPYSVKYWDKDYVENMQQSFVERKRLEQETFGVQTYLPVQEFNSVYAATGIDVDGRVASMQKAFGHVQRGIVKYIMFAKNIPGFLELPNDDKISLIRGARFEYWLLGHFQHFNSKLGVSVGHEIAMTREDAHRLFGSSLPNIDMMFTFCESLKKLDMSYEETAILKGIVLLFRDRCQLWQGEKIEAMQWKLIQCLKYLIKQQRPQEVTRRFTDFINKLVAMRDLTEMNKQHNRRVDGLHMDVLKNHQLVYECLVYDGDEKES